MRHESIKVRLVLGLFALLSAAGMGAMTRDQICIEQNGWNQASAEYGTRYGYNIWTPYGSNSDEWICWQNVLRPASACYSYTIGGTLAEGDTFTLTIGAVNITSAAADATPTAVEAAAALAAAWEASSDALVEPIYAYNAAGTAVVFLRGIPGEGFTVTESKSSTNGTIAEALVQAAGATPETFDMFGAFKAKVKSGYYMALNKAIVNNSAGPIWYPDPDGAGTDFAAGKDIQNSAAWAASSASFPINTNGFMCMYTTTATRTLTLKVPSGVTRLYMLGVPVTSTGARTIAIASETGDEAKFTLIKSTVNFAETGDFVTYGENVYPPFTEVSNSTYDGYPDYRTVCLIATNFTSNASIKITPTTAASNVCYICGFIAINDSVAAQPDTGVFDPTTIEYLMPTSYNATGTYPVQTPYSQYAEGPIYLNLAGGASTFWGNGHWAGDASSNAANTLISPSCIVTYNATADIDAVFFSISGSTLVAQTENAWVRYVADSVMMTTTGTIGVHDGTSGDADNGTFRLVHQYTSAGMSVMQKWLFNDTTLNLEVSDGNGGYVAQWSLDNQFKKYLRIPYDSIKQTVGAFDVSDADDWTANVTMLSMYDEINSVTALFSCGFTYYDASSLSGLSKPLMRLNKRILGDGFYKIYMNPVEDTPDSDIAIDENDEIYSWQMRSFYPTSYLGSSGGASGAVFKNSPFSGN